MGAGALDVQAAALGARQRPRGGDVHHGAGRADDDDDPALDVGRVGQAADRADREHAGQDEERGAVDLGAQDLRAAQAERERPAGRPRRQRGRHEREAERAGVRDHVRGVGEQRQRSGDEAADDLDDHERRDEPERDPEPAAVGVGVDPAVRVAVVVVVVRVIVHDVEPTG